ncbi:hypothetical protein SEA_FIZZLES_74 [Microbacterium phage Fizzles]|nr:hypothetical protein SEA_FIZZLES_74 [Microbacterium phage Fizzles]
MADFDADADTATIIHLADNGNDYTPPAIRLDAERRALGGLGPGDAGASLIGFVDPGVEEVSVLADDAFDEPEKAVGKWPVFGRAGIIRWAAAVERIEFVEVVDG